MPTPRDDVAHLLRRAGFGGTVAQIDTLATTQDLTTIVDDLLNFSGAPADTPPAGLTDPAVSSGQRYLNLIWWWYDRMATTTKPLQEKLTFFWHGHFCSEDRDVGSQQLMYQQNALYRANCAGNFRTFTKAMSIEPAMLRYLNNETNRVGKVQENFARELWELFMLGVDNYTQDEVVESARAWTGHGLNSARDTYSFNPSRHDNGNKTIFGQTANFDGPGVIDWTLDGPKGTICARYIVTKLWKFFANTNPTSTVIDTLAATFQSSWDIAATVRQLLLMPEFYAPECKGQLVRSPVEYMAAAIKLTGVPAATARPDSYHVNMNQELLNPPDVSGWKSNGYWISSAAYWARAAFAKNIANKAKDAGVLAGTNLLSVNQAVDAAIAQFGLTSPSTTTVNAMRSWLTAERSASGYSAVTEQVNLMVLVLLSPDFNIA
ncbi:MAG: DUF1800 family protein [Acidimicrobiia bacterium]